MKILFLCLFVVLGLKTFPQHIEILEQGRPVSIRGLSVLNDSVAWLSGSKGTIAVTTDGGKTWQWRCVQQFPNSDFRDIHAFSATEAVVMSSGTPTLILKTEDSGRTWQVNYENSDPRYFFDAMDFDDQGHGILLGDPIGGNFLLLESYNRGATWKPFVNLPRAMPGEAAFAASGTCLRVDHKNISIVTGGTFSRLLEFDRHWTGTLLPLAHGMSSQGAFSVIITRRGTLVVGGDFANQWRRDSVAAIRTSQTAKFLPVLLKGPNGYQSCIEAIGNDFLSTGTTGSNFSKDGGRNWRTIDGTSFNVCAKARYGSLVLLAGDHGRVAIFHQ